MNELIAASIVLAMVVGLAWLARTGRLGQALARRGTGLSVETAVSLGDRRSLVIVAVEGRRLLLGVTAGQVTVVTELASRPPEAPLA